VTDKLGGWLSDGMPVVVWCRNDDLSARFDLELSGILANGGVMSLPTAIHRLRQDAAGPDHPHDHVGMHITLLWDLAWRTPPDEHRLRDPVQQRT
jgi:hypothetical protein